MVAADLCQVAQFLGLLDPVCSFTFQVFPESDGARVYAAVFHGSLEQHASRLMALNEQGGGIFVMVNAGDGVIRRGEKTCRTAANVQRVRAVFVDLDGAPIAPVLESALLPDWVVQSSPGRWHAYWKVADCPLERFGTAHSVLAQRFDGDSAVKDLPRVMRIPDFYHRKATPFMSALYLPSDYHRIQGQQ